MPAVVGALIATVNGGGKQRPHAARRHRVAGRKRDLHLLAQRCGDALQKEAG